MKKVTRGENPLFVRQRDDHFQIVRHDGTVWKQVFKTEREAIDAAVLNKKMSRRASEELEAKLRDAYQIADGGMPYWGDDDIAC